MIMKKILLFSLLIFLIQGITFAQTCSTSNGNQLFFNVCEGGATGDSFTYTGNYEIQVGNNHELVINGDVTINGTLTIKLVGSTSSVLIQSPYALNATSVVFEGSATGKVLTVEGNDGAFNVDETLDFGGNNIEIDGEGSISAREIINGEGVTCTQPDGDPNQSCPLFNVETCDEPNGICQDEALPIELKSFSASKSAQNINLDWVTAKEENFSHFEIERSIDQNNWNQIGLVQGMGESMSDVNYDFTDRNAPFGMIYYRLKAVDIDATFEYFQVIKIENGFEGKLAVSPNPVKDAASLKIQVPSEFREDLAYVGLFDLSGVMVQEFRNFNTDGSLQINQKLKSGMYILKVNHNGLQENIRVIVQ